MSSPRALCTGLLQMFSEGLLNFLGSKSVNRGRQKLLPKPANVYREIFSL
ncbi:hypothetical protein [Sphingobacterium sp.]|nr:hypothetical protein [Sphingobacterium sp.]